MTTLITSLLVKTGLSIFFFYKAWRKYKELDVNESPVIVMMYTQHFWGWLLLGAMLLINVLNFY